MRTLLLNLLFAMAMPFAQAAGDADAVGTLIPPGTGSDELAQLFTRSNAVVIASVILYVEPMCNPDSLPPKGARIQELTFLDDRGQTLRIHIPRADAHWEAKLAQAMTPGRSDLAYMPVAYVVPGGRYRLQSHTVEVGMIARRAPASGWTDGSPEIVTASGLPENGTFVAEAGKPVYIGHFYLGCGAGSVTVPNLHTDDRADKRRYPQVVSESYPGLNLEQLIRAPLRQGPLLGMQPRNAQ